jgi:hypothetical protein
MRFDFWNNPLVVTAFRIKQRKGGLMLTPPIYMLVLCAAGALLEYYHPQHGFLSAEPVQKVFLIGILSLQFVISPALAAIATASSMRTEVANRTLDFQRIAALSPRQILLGKLLGEPALAYLLILATVPFTAWCWARGVNGLGSGFDRSGTTEYLLIYLLLCCTTLLFGTAGLQHRLEITEGQLAARGASGGPIWVWIMLSVWASVGHAARGLPTSPWYAVPAAILSPVLPVAGLGQDDPWLFTMPFFQWRVPYLVLTPLVQLFVAFLCFECMARRLINPLNTVLPRGWAYVALILADVICAGAVYDPTEEGFMSIAAAFWLVHILVALEILTGTTAWKESLHSWVWRYRGRGRRWRDLLLGRRSENTAVLAAYCVIGLAVFLLGVVLPARNRHIVYPDVAAVAAVAIAALLFFGTVLQWTTFFAGRYGSGLMFGLVAILIVAPHLAGLYYENEWLLSVSLSAHFAAWLLPGSAGSSRMVLHVWPVLTVLIALLALVTWHFRRSLGRLEHSVDRYLERMQVPEAMRAR